MVRASSFKCETMVDFPFKVEDQFLHQVEEFGRRLYNRLYNYKRMYNMFLLIFLTFKSCSFTKFFLVCVNI